MKDQNFVYGVREKRADLLYIGQNQTEALLTPMSNRVYDDDDDDDECADVVMETCDA